MSDSAIHWEARRRQLRNNHAFKVQGVVDNLSLTHGRVVATNGFKEEGTLVDLLAEITTPEILPFVQSVLQGAGVDTLKDLDNINLSQLIHAGLKPAVARRLKAARLKHFHQPSPLPQNNFMGLDGLALPPINTARLPTLGAEALSVYGAADTLNTQSVTGKITTNTNRQDMWTMGRADKMLMREHMYGWGGSEKPKQMKDFRRLRQRHIANWRPPFQTGTAV